MGEQEKKISTATAIFVMGLLIFIDIIEMALDFIGIGFITGPVINIPLTIAIRMWTYMKGINGTASLVGSAIEFIPIINMLPIRSATMAATIFIANNPKLAQAAGAARGKITKPGAPAMPSPTAHLPQAPRLQAPLQPSLQPITIKPTLQ